MDSTSPQVHRVERVDDIPILLATLRRLNVPDVLDRHFPSGHRWKGELTFGEVACVWVAFITSQGDHRLCQLQPWAKANLHTLAACLGKPVRPLDFQDDRLADMLGRLALGDSWQGCEVDLNRHTVRVYHLDPKLFRVDTTTANSYVETLSQLGLFQFGHSKDRDDQPQIKVALATLDPLGLPVTTLVVPGNCADDPLYVPEIKKVQQAFGTGGKTFVGDCKAASLGTRAYLASTQDYYLCPLSEEQLPQLNERKRGKKRLTGAELAGAAEGIVQEQRVADMLTWEVRTTTHRKAVRAYGGRPARVLKEHEHRLEVSPRAEVIEQAKREMGWRVYATNQLPLNLAGVVWGYRGQNRLEDNWSRLKGQPLGLMPMYLQQESRILGLVLLLSLALRLLTLVEWAVREKLREGGQTLKGLYPGQAGRQAKRPSAELLLQAFKGISLAIVETAGRWVAQLTPLTALQQRLLDLWGLPPDLYHRLTLHFPEPPPI